MRGPLAKRLEYLEDRTAHLVLGHSKTDTLWFRAKLARRRIGGQDIDRFYSLRLPA